MKSITSLHPLGVVGTLTVFCCKLSVESASEIFKKNSVNIGRRYGPDFSAMFLTRGVLC